MRKKLDVLTNYLISTSASGIAFCTAITAVLSCDVTAASRLWTSEEWPPVVAFGLLAKTSARDHAEVWLTSYFPPYCPTALIAKTYSTLRWSAQSYYLSGNFMENFILHHILRWTPYIVIRLDNIEGLKVYLIYMDEAIVEKCWGCIPF